MKSKPPSYLQHFETLTALVTHLAMTQFSLRTPHHLAKALSIDKNEITVVLESFKGLFRRSPKGSKQGNAMYTLQLRHARQWLHEGAEETEDQKKPPLEPEYVIALLDFVARKADEEARSGLTIKSTAIASGVALTASLVTLLVTLLSAAK